MPDLDAIMAGEVSNSLVGRVVHENWSSPKGRDSCQEFQRTLVVMTLAEMYGSFVMGDTIFCHSLERETWELLTFATGVLLLLICGKSQYLFNLQA